MATLTERAITLREVGLTPLLNTDQMAAYYGVTRWTVNAWVKAGCPLEPTASRGRRFDLLKVQAWQAANATGDEPDLVAATA